ncbi:MAG TPA: Do family serine endopeptidase [Patescibacteria group bacterium]|nr:Do family serine endopeptidase [Patescibacteria group bacterium]
MPRYALMLPLLLAAATSHAQLPAAVDGQPLPSLAPMIERAQPAVVNIHSQTHVKVRDPFFDDPFFRRFFNSPAVPRERVQQSLGSGVIVDAVKGYVLTNNHVIDGADDIQVTLSDGRTLKGRFIGSDPDSDVALVQIPAERLSALPLANSDGLRVGDFVVAIGNPFGIGQSVTSGIVSALGRSGLRGVGVQDFIQTDASINPGNSGGALVNLRGELVGINTAIYSPSGGNVGIGFAIPARLAKDVMRQLLAYGEVKRGSLGADTQDITADLAPMLGLKDTKGAVVTRVLARSPAASAGLREGDVITALNGKAVNAANELANLEGLLPVGTQVAISVLRDGQPITLSAILKPTELRQIGGEKLEAGLAGATLGDLPDKLRRQGLSGVLVTAVAQGSRAATHGLRANDLIAAVNQVEVRDLTELETRIAKRRSTQLLLTVVRGRGAFYLLVE